MPMIDSPAPEGHAGRAMPTPTSSDPLPQPVFACLPAKVVVDHVATVLEPESPLSQSERARAEALSGPGQRRDFVAARLLTRLLLRRWDGDGVDLAAIADFVLEQSCVECCGPHGRPAEVFGVCGLVGPCRWFGRGRGGLKPGWCRCRTTPRSSGRRARWGRGTPRLGRGEAIVKWGHGTLDDSLTWRPLLEGPPAPRGQRYAVDAEGKPRRLRRRPFAHASGLVLTDAPADVEGALCSVAAERAARWVDPLL